MNGEVARPESSHALDRALHGFGNVVELEVEKKSSVDLGRDSSRVGAEPNEELEAYLEDADGRCRFTRKRACFLQRRDVQRESDVIFRAWQSQRHGTIKIEGCLR